MRLLIADDRELMCEGISHLCKDRPDFEIMAVVGTTASLMEALHKRSPDVLLVNAMFASASSMRLLNDVAIIFPRVAIVALASDNGWENPVSLLKAGAQAYVSKTNTPADLFESIEKAARGKISVSPEIGEDILKMSGVRPWRKKSGLSRRETEVYNLLASGKSVSQIATVLGLSVKTVSSHKKRVMEHIGVSTLSELVRHALLQREADLFEGGTTPKK